MYLQGRIRATGGEAFQAAGFDPRVAFDVDGQSESMQHEKMPALPFINALNHISLDQIRLHRRGLVGRKNINSIDTAICDCDSCVATLSDTRKSDRRKPAHN